MKPKFPTEARISSLHCLAYLLKIAQPFRWRLTTLSILVASATEAFGQVMYSVTDLGFINTSYALSINTSGQIAVNETAISILSPYSPLGKSINDSGQTVQGDYLYSGGTATTLGSPAPGDANASGINNSGQVVGTVTTTEATGGGGFNQAFLYTGGTMTDLGQGSAIAINNSGQIVGFTTVLRGNIPYHAFLFSSGIDLGAMFVGDPQSWATAINNNGQVVGQYDNSSYHAFLYSGGTMTDLGALPGTASSEAHGINDSGQIVGYCFNNVNGAGVDAFIYNNGTMTDLNSLIPANSDWDLINAEGINNNGQIVGYGTNPSGQTDAFLLTPVPEPSTDALSVTGAAVLVASRRIKYRVTIH